MSTLNHTIMWLIAERCDAEIYTGWHIYLRDAADCRRNADGGWGWIRRDHWILPSIHALLASMGIVMRLGGDGSRDDDGYAAFARRHQLGDGRGGLAVVVSDRGVERPA